MIDVAHLRHSLRTPLNHIIGYSEMMLEDAEEQNRPAVLDGLRQVQEAAQELLQAVQRNIGPSRETISKAEWKSLHREASEPIHRILAHVSNLVDSEGVHVPDMLRIRSAAIALNDLLDTPLASSIDTSAQAASPTAAPAEARLMVVDDDEANRDVLSRQLERLGYTALTAGSGPAALEALRHSSFDVVLLDIIMPGMDGFAVLAAMKADVRLRQLPVIVISALDEMQSVARCIEMGADDFVSKPFDRIILKSRIEAVIKRRDAENERSQLAERFRLLLESTGEGIFGLDRDGECVFINATAVNLLGVKREQLLGKGLARVLSYRSPGGVPCSYEDSAMNRAARYGEPSRVTDAIFAAGGGEGFPVDYSANPIVRDGRIDGAVITFSDISDRKLTEEKFRQTAKLESLGVLAGGVAHDFNNLLTGILGNASLVLSSDDLKDEDREKLEYVVKASERAADLTRQMLAYAGKGRYDKRDVDVSALVTETLGLLHTLIPKTVHITLDLRQDLPAVHADPIQVQQVVMNLVINAGEAIGEPNIGTITVRTYLDCVNGERAAASKDLGVGPHVVIEVTDTGGGMTPEVRARIFDPFFTTKFTGRGLGLAAVLGIVKSHKGVIEVESTLGQGTRFRVLLPASNKDPEAPCVEVKPAAAFTGTGRVLVVDDEAVVRRTTDAVLRHGGFDTVLASTGDEAVELLRKDPRCVAVVLLDMMMPGMSGDEAFSHIRSIRADLPVIVSSGYGESQVMRYFAGRDVSAFIQKPYTASNLVSIIRSVLAGQAPAMAQER